MGQYMDILVRLAAAVAAQPDAIAVESHDGTYSYRELDKISNCLANRLINCGVTTECCVGVSLERGATELIALLAISKAGGAYVPLDPTHPTERLQLIVEDAKPTIMLLTSDSPLTGIGGMNLLLDDVADSAKGFAEELPEQIYSPDQLAYVLFTSGSTGRPKGVEIPRGAFANFISSMLHTPGLRSKDRLLAITTTSFDISGLELFLPLAAGATVVIADKEMARDPRLLKRRLEVGDISVMQATPAMWRLLLEAGWSGNGRLRMLCGGEALSTGLADRLLQAGSELWNMYGPTETTVWSTVQKIEHGYDRITIGNPIDATNVHVLDETMKPVAPGIEGELYIGGDGLARGYRGRPDLTESRFVTYLDPAGEQRLYRTGDLGRQLPDGRFECLGRLDHQVKIRGFRVELGEVEATLKRVNGTNEVLVMADTSTEGDPRLIAYWTGVASKDSLEFAADSSLPHYMRPAAYVQLTYFPLNTNGKVDRAKLPSPRAEAVEVDGPRQFANDMEARVAAAWSEVLNLPHVPLQENFFSIGGTSFLALRVLQVLERNLGQEIALKTFFEEPTVRGIASRIENCGDSDEPVVIWLKRGSREKSPVFCLFGIAIYMNLAAEMGAERSVVAMHIPFKYFPAKQTPPNLQEMASRYVTEIRKHQSSGPYRLLGLCFGGVVAYEAARILEELGEVVESVTVIDAVLPGAVTRLKSRWILGTSLQLFQDPLPTLQKLAKRLSWLPHLNSKKHPETEAEDRLKDVEIDGPEMARNLQEFSKKDARLKAELLIVRAADEPTSPWIRISKDQGWSGRSGMVRVIDVAADHLGVLRYPAVRDLAIVVIDSLSRF